MAGLNLDSHGQEEGDKEQHAAGQGDHFLGAQVRLGLSDLATVWQETQDGCHSAGHHDNESKNENNV